MIENTLLVGDTGTLIIDDNTDGPDKTVDFWIESSSVVSVPQLPWTYSVDGVMKPWQQFNFLDNEERQHLGLIYVGPYAAEVTLHLGDTATTQLDGPVDMVVPVNGSANQTVSITVGGVVKKAIPFVNVAGVWKQVVVYVLDKSTWRRTT